MKRINLILCMICTASMILSSAALRAQWRELGQGTSDALRADAAINTVFRDAAGNIYAAGNFSLHHSNAYYIAKWDGSSWRDLSNSSKGSIFRAICSDASGNIYAAGEFFRNIVNNNCSSCRLVTKWDHSTNTWSELGGATSLAANNSINTLCSDASGNIYAAGSFTNSSRKCYVAKWNGSAWSELGGINALAANGSISSIFSDAAGNIYAAGAFTNAGGRPYVAQWNGSAWSELGGGNSFPALSGSIATIHIDASGNIYAGGGFNNSGNYYVAKWNGSSWSSMGGLNSDILSISSDGSGNIYAGGNFTNGSGKKYIAKWNGSAWIELIGNNALAANDKILSICSDAAGNVYAGGNFTDSIGYRYVSKWNGTGWSQMGSTTALDADDNIGPVCIDASGNIYAAGNFVNGSGNRYVAKWDHSTNIWSELGGLNALAPNGYISALCSDASGHIYAAGNFTNGSGSRYVAKWNGSTWSELGGLNSLAANGFINSICSDASGNIYAAGSFANGSGHLYVARWDHNTNGWSELGGPNGLAANNGINSICSDASGNIYAAGSFTNSISPYGGHKYVAKWDHHTGNWSELGGANALAANGDINSVCLDPSGNVYAAGIFADTLGAMYIAKWDGSIWSRLGGDSIDPFTGQGLVFTDPYIGMICSDPSGNIYAVGNFTAVFPGASGNNYVAKWNGSNWSELGDVSSFSNDGINSVCSDASGNIYSAGSFYDSNGYGFVAEYPYCLPTYSNSTVSICASALPYSWNGLNIASAGYDTVHLINAGGCDSMAVLHLTLRPAATATITTTICSGGSYAGHTSSGTYTDHYTSVDGCDSARTLNLTVSNAIASTVTTNICAGSSYAGHTVSGSYTDHYTSVSGCDSARTLVLTVYPAATATQFDTINAGSSITVGTQTFTTAGQYSVTIANGSSHGCDSVITVYLYVRPAVTCTAVSVTCNNTNLDITSVRIMTATPANAGSNPIYNWYKNGVQMAGVHNAVLSYGGGLGNGDQIYCTLTTTVAVTCGANTFAAGQTVSSNVITFTKSGSGVKDIIAFSMPAQVGTSVINSGAATVSVVVTTAPAGRTAIHPTRITVSPGASYGPSYANNRDFSIPVTYIVTAQNGSTKVWTVTVRDQNGNKTNDAINEVNTVSEMSIYPDPAIAYLTVKAQGGAEVPVITILDMEGRVMYNQALPVTDIINHQIDLSGFAAGTYVVYLAVGERLETRKFVVKK